MAISHILGFPRIGEFRETKKHVESYWKGEKNLTDLDEAGATLSSKNWKLQSSAGLNFVTVGDFSWYDHVLDTTTLLGVVPERFGVQNKNINLNTYFCMARGQAPDGQEAIACEMTKWFNTNYHYIVPELTRNQEFRLASDSLFRSIDAALKQGHHVKPVLLGPLSFLYLSKTKGEDFDKLRLLKKILPIYEEIFSILKAKKIDWIQLDEPVLVLDLSQQWQTAFKIGYQQLNFQGLKILLTTYFGRIDDKISLVNELPIHGLHVDFSDNLNRIYEISDQLDSSKILSAGVINGRNIWKADLNKILAVLKPIHSLLHDRLWISTSCSLLHVPVNLENEITLDPTIKQWLAFAKQKVEEVVLLTQVLNQGEANFANELIQNAHDVASRNESSLIHQDQVQKRLSTITPAFAKRKNPYVKRALVQKDSLNLPLFPTTTIGSFPQTDTIRTIRKEYKSGTIDHPHYVEKIRSEIRDVIKVQEELELDVLVHGEAERNDMVEYFGELLNGFAFTSNGWVQSYGSRCVKPPIIYGDVFRAQPMTVEWIQYAQSLTTRSVKGMLTGPVTILAWSFVRDDQPHSKTALQIALALRDEVEDLEKSGINIIQIDEPAFRETLPLRQSDWQDYLSWAVFAFRVTSSGVSDHTQIHTHMCYSEFNDVIDAISDLDADVITIECSRSDMELLKAFESFSYPNEIGPGVYDIHSPRIPDQQEIITLVENALKYVPIERLWINPDCGLKTRHWPETKAALKHMVAAAKQLRARCS